MPDPAPDTLDGPTDDPTDDAGAASFLPPDYLAAKRRRRANVAGAALLAVVTAGLGAAFVAADAGVRDQEARLAASSARIAVEAKRIEAVRSMQARQRAVARRAELAAGLLEPVPRSYLLAEVTNALPPGASLTELSLEARPRKPKPAEGTAYDKRKKSRKAEAEPEASALAYDVGVRVAGVAETDAQVGRFLTALSASPLFEHSGATATESFEQGGRRLRRFKLELSLRPDARAEVRDTDADSTDRLAGAE